MDIADQAADAEAIERDSLLYQALKAAKAPLAPKGACHFCEAPVGPSLRFCDGDCREGWDREARAKKRNGSAED